MSYTPTHADCPHGTMKIWGGQRTLGRQTPVYMRESVEVERAGLSYRWRQHKRRWVRVGTLCLNCGRFELTWPTMASAAATVDHSDRDGLPEGDLPAVDHSGQEIAGDGRPRTSAEGGRP